MFFTIGIIGDRQGMKNLISSDLVIGNFVIEAVGSKRYQIGLNDFFQFEVILSENLKKKDYYTNISRLIINEFAEEYPFFVKSIDDQYIKLTEYINDDDERRYRNMLLRYFRIGVPSFIVEEVQLASNILLG